MWHRVCCTCSQLVFIPNWILLCLAIIAILYAVALAIVLLRSPDVAPEHKQNAAVTALGYSAALVPLLVFLVRLAFDRPVPSRPDSAHPTRPNPIPSHPILLFA